MLIYFLYTHIHYIYYTRKWLDKKTIKERRGEWEILMRVIGSGHIGVQIR